MGSSYPDAMLVADLRQGFQKACDELYDQLYHRLFFIAFRYVDNQMEAEDIAIESLNKLFSSKEDFSSMQHITAWLMTVTRNRCADYIRKRDRQELVRAKIRMGLEMEEGLIRDMEESERIFRLMLAIKRLPKKERMAIELYFFEEWSHKEIAAELNVKSQSVAKMKERAIKTLRDLLHPDRRTVEALLVCLLLYISQLYR